MQRERIDANNGAYDLRNKIKDKVKFANKVMSNVITGMVAKCVVGS